MGRTEKSIFQDANQSAIAEDLGGGDAHLFLLRGLEQGWISSRLARLGPARAGSAQLVEDRRQATASDKADEPEPAHMLNCNIRLLLAREPALMNGKIF